MNNSSNNTGFKFPYFQIEFLKYLYKIRKRKNNAGSSGYVIQTPEIIESNLNQNSPVSPDKPGSACESSGLKIYSNQTESFGDYVTLNFYLPRTGQTKLILMNSHKTEAMYLINKRLKAGLHTFKTEIRYSEPEKFECYLKLKSGRNTEVMNINLYQVTKIKL